MKSYSVDKLSTLEREALIKQAIAENLKRKQLKNTSIPHADRDQRLPLSFAQQRLWFLAQMEGASEAYHIAGGIRLTGALDVAALRRALDRIVARHEALRTLFIEQDGEASQLILNTNGGFTLLEHDLSTDASPSAALARLSEQEAQAPFDLARGPLARGRLVRLAADEHVLLITLHHIIADGWSMGVLIDELGRLYASYSRGEGDPLPPLPIQYADYAVWQRRWVEGEQLHTQAVYWRQTLAGAPALLELPGDRPRPAQQDYAGALLAVRLEADLSARLKAFSQQHGATLFMTLLAGWALTLSRLSGQDDLVIGTSSANRGRAEIEGLIGFFVNTLALRIDLSDSPTVAALIERVKIQTLNAQAHQDIPFEQVVEIVQPPRSLAHAPLFQVMFDWQNTPGGKLSLPGLSLAPVDVARASAQFDLSLSLQEDGDAIVGSLEYATALFDQDTVARYLGYWQALLAGMVADDSQAVARLPMISEAERRQVLYGWNATQADYPKDRCAHELFEAQALQTPEADALIWDGGRLSYAELNVKTNQLAHHLRGLGVGPDDRVAICAERGPDMIIGLLAILKAGGAYVPLDPAYPEERLAYMLTDSAPAVLLIQSGLAARFADCAPAVPRLLLDADPAPWAAQPGANLDPQALGLTPRHLAYVIYTSGSTGQPKGVMIEHQSLVNYSLGAAEVFELTGADTVLQQNSLNFDLSVEEIFPALLSGATLAPSERLFGMDSDLRPTFVHLTAAHWHTLVAEWERSPDKAREQLAGVRLLNVTGDALSPQKLQAWEALWPDKPTKLVNTYGPTEATVSCTAAYVKHNPEMASVTIGRPMANTRLYFLDAQGEPVPLGVAGEIHVAGDGVARGYLNRPDLNAERFIQDPFSNDPEARLYKTGDQGRWLADGSIEFLGRNDFQVKVRGFRIELGEIEARLAAHPAVRETAVLAREDGAGGKRLVAYYTSDADVSVDSLRAHLAEALPEYMVPAAFVPLEALPLTVNGKLDRKALPEPDADALQTRQYEAPQGEAEQTLAAIWAELLKVDQVGRHDNFFELGGHSLLAVTLIARMRQAGLNTDVRELFAAPTLAGLAALADSGNASEQLVIPPNRIPVGCTAITPDLLPLVSLSQADIDRITAAVPGGAANVQDIYPLAPLQEGILFHHLMESEGDAYLMPVLMAFDKRERLDGFLTALQAVIDRHDILRTAVAWEGLPEPVQIVWRQAPLNVEEVMLDPEAGETAEQLAERYDPRHYRLDMRVAPLINGFIAYDPGEGRWLLLLLAHHLAFDNTALDLLLEEIRMHQLGQAEQLPAPLPFRNFVAQSRLGMKPEEHEAFFHGMLADVDEPTAPFGLLDVLGDGSRAQEARLAVDADLARRVREQARSLGISAAGLFHLAWAAVLARTSGRDDVVFGTVLFGRMQGGEGADRTLGMFINTLPLRVRLAQGTVLEQVRDVQQRLAGLLRHEHVPLSLAQRCSGVQAPAPLFSALLNYRYSQTEGSEGSVAAWQGIEILSSGEERSNYPIVLSVDDLGEGFSLSAQTLSPAAPERLCALMHTALDNLLDALESAPDTAMRRIGVLPEAERRQVLYDWNATRADYPRDRCLHELFEAQVARSPEADAVVWDGKRLSYAELNARANRLAHYLRSLGVKPDDRVAICLERGFELMISLLAVLKAGAAYVPLDPAYPEERLAFMLEDSAPLALLTDAGLKARLADRSGGARVIDLSSDAAQWAHQSSDNPDLAAVGLTPRNLAYVIYTSGSTGQPKGVMVPHAGVMNLVSWHNRQFQVSAADRATQLAGLAFDASAWETWPYLLAGACLHLVRPELLGQPEALWQRLTDDRITVAFMPTPLAELMLTTPRPEHLALRCLLAGGDRLHGYPPAGLPFELVNNYGPTENSVVSTSCPVPAGNEGLPPIGKPIANTRIYLLDAQGEPVPVGVAGEIHVAGDGIARGYLNRPELTAERFIADPFSNDPEARLYKTGDLGRWREDGSIEFLGRNDFQVKVRGFRIELGEIEAQLAACDGVLEAVVIAREDHPGDKRLVAYLTASAELNIDELRAQLKAVLPEYMVPSAFMILDALPLTPNGKLDRKALPVPEGDAYGAREYEAPQGKQEEALAAIWQDILGIERVGRHDHFFELGGHSLLAVQVITRIRQGMGCELALRDLFDHPVLQDLARQLQQSDANTLAPIERADRGQPLPLSFAQQRLWFIAQMEGASEAYHIAGGIRLTGVLAETALRRALDRIVARHEALRTLFIEQDGEASQLILNTNGGFTLLEHDLSTDADPSAALARLSEQEAQAPFDLARGPLARGRLVRLAADEHVLLITLHHIIADGWSMGVLIDELGRLYASYSRGEDDPLPPLPIQYADYAVWQRRWIEGEQLCAQAAYWRQTLAGAPALLELPSDRPRPAQQDYAGAQLAVRLDADLSARLKAFSQQHGATLFMTLLAGWALTLSRLSGQDDVVIGTPSANRGRAEIEGLIGFFVNTLALRIDLSDSPTVADLVERVKIQTLNAQAHQDIPFEQVVEIVQPPRSLAHAPLFQVMFGWQNTPGWELSLSGLSLAPVDVAHASAQFDLSLLLREDGDAIVGSLEYATALFDPDTVARYLGYWQALLAGMVADDSQAVARLPMLGEAERRQVLYGWNATQADYPKASCVHELLEAQALQTPEADAVVWNGGRLSYAELNARANRLAHHLRRIGVAAGDFIPVVMARSVEMLVAQLAVLKSGCAYVPIDPEFPADRQAFMIQDCQARQVIVAQDSAAGRDWPSVQVLDLAQANEAIAHCSSADLHLQRAADTPAYIMYTSGSTGVPKGVIVPHRAINRLVINNGYARIEPTDCVAHCSNPAFDASTFEIWGALLNGARILIIPQSAVLEPETFAHSLTEQGATTLFLTTALFNQYAVILPAALARLKHLLFGGERASPAIVKQFLDSQPQCRLLNAYGPTETTTFATSYSVEAIAEQAESIPIGRPITNTRIYILDPQRQPVPIGVAGEIYIGGPGVAQGYLNQPELTAERFIADPFVNEPGAQLYKTGDLGCWRADGNIDYLGRNDHQVKIRGFRIEPGEIEARLAEYPGVRETAVLAREDVPGDKRLVAYYTGDAGLTADSLRAYLAETLPEYMVPAAFVPLEALPLTANGKLDRKALPVPEGDAYGAREYEAPQGETEETLAALWAELLKVDRVGRHDNFFELGGHSLLAVTLIARMRRAGLNTDVQALFTTPTLAGLAAAVGGDSLQVLVPPNAIPADATAITPDLLPLVALSQADIDRITAAVPGGAANVQDIYPLAPLQEGILFHHLMESEGDAYLLPHLMAFDTRERLDSFLSALQAVIARHDILRTSVAWEGLPEPVQVVWRAAELAIEEVVIDPETGDTAEQLQERYDPRHYRVDVRVAPMINGFTAYDPREGRWLLLLLTHHLALDHTALTILLEEIQMHQLNQAEQLPAPLPFRNFVAQARLGMKPEEHEAFFRGMLADVDEPTAPFGLLDVLGDGSGIQEAELTVATDLARRLREQSRSLGISAAGLFHLAWAAVLSRTSGRDDVVFGTVLFGRMQSGEGAGRVLGMFINTLPLRVRLDQGSVLEQVRDVQNRLAGLLRHEHAPLSLAQRCSGVQAPAPLFSALLNYRHSQVDASADSAAAWQGIETLSGGERTNYPIVLDVDDLGEGFSLTAQTLPPVAPERLCAMMHTALENLITALENAPDTAMGRIGVLPEAERRQVLYDWNATQADYPQYNCVHELFEAQVRDTPDAPAVVFEDQTLTYAELNARANRLAHYLRRSGVGPDVLVAICAERSLEMVVGLLGILKAGGAYVPLDPAYPADRLAYMLADAAPRVLLTQERLKGILPWTESRMIALDSDWRRIAEQPDTNLPPQSLGLTSRHLAYVIYTSGSTGQPKGAMNEHRGVVNRLNWMQKAYGLTADDAVLQKTPFSFDVSVWEFFWPLFTGARLVMAKPEGHKDPVYLSEIIQRQRITTLHFVPPMLQIFLEHGKAADCTSLRRVICSGEALPVALSNRFHELLTHSELHNLYGPTEAAIDVTAWACEAGTSTNSIPIGRPIDNTRIYILDAQGQPVPVGVPGELFIGGVQVGRGYLNRPELSAERFIADPFSSDPEARLYKTGDLVRWREDGSIEYLGRNDFQVKIRGFRIELGEIEARLAEHPAVRETAVLAREDGPGGKQLVAYYTGDADVTVDSLRAHLAETLPEYMVPAAFVHLAALPLSPNGKLDRKALPAPDAGALQTRQYEAPQGETEQALADIWAELLKVDRVGRHDNFFELGGHSLLAISLIEKMGQKGLTADVRVVFTAPTLAKLAEAVEEEQIMEIRI
jgi:amino acid adenylation domain-containing protein